MMKKKLTSFLLALTLLLGLSLTACGGESDDTVPANEEPVYDLGVYEGTWLGDENNLYGACIIEFDAEGNWLFYIEGNLRDDGDLQYDPEREALCLRSTRGGAIEGGGIELENGRLYIDTCGYFDYYVGDWTEEYWYGNSENEDYTYYEDYNYNEDYYYEDNNYYGDYDYNGDYGIYQRDISDFRGTWYLDNDLAAEIFIVIDSDGYWSYYQRVPGDPEATVMDCGILCPSENESGVFYANSSMYNELSFRLYELDEDIFVWDDTYTFYRIEW